MELSGSLHVNNFARPHAVVPLKQLLHIQHILYSATYLVLSVLKQGSFMICSNSLSNML